MVFIMHKEGMVEMLVAVKCLFERDVIFAGAHALGELLRV